MNNIEEDQLLSDEERNKENIFKKGKIWRPTPKIETTFTCFIIVGVVFIIIGIVLLVYTSKIHEVKIRYDNISKCNSILMDNVKNFENDNYEFQYCRINLTVEKTIEKPVMFYIELHNFYQNHRRYIKSYSAKQLKGKILSTKEIKDECDPIITMQDLGRTKSISKKILDKNKPAHPCGLIARSIFNDTIDFYKNPELTEQIIVSTDGITWKSDKKGRYKNVENYRDIQWLNVEEERFMVWMKPSSLPNFRKLWGKIHQDINPGQYYIKIVNNYPVDDFNGKKYIILSNVNAFGGKNTFLGVCYIIVGALSLSIGIIFVILHLTFNKKKDKKMHQQ